MRRMFFGWQNIKWFCREFLAMYSTSDSYFSKKRFESSIAFISAISIIGYHVWYTKDTITNAEVLADAALLFAVGGYTVNQIQSEKKITPPTPPTPPKKENFSADEDAV